MNFQKQHDQLSDLIQEFILFQLIPFTFKLYSQKVSTRQNAGFAYCTCSFPSLERVFMEIVRKSEEEAEQEQNEQIDNQTSNKKTKFRSPGSNTL